LKLGKLQSVHVLMLRAEEFV